MDAKFHDSLYEGDSAAGAKLGMGLTGGDFWARVAGAQILYRGASFERVDFEEILAAGDIDAAAVSVPDYLSHAGGSSYVYVLRQVNLCGREGLSATAAVRVVFDGDGELAGDRCVAIFDVNGFAVDGGKVKLSWYYQPIGPGPVATSFDIYSDGATGVVDMDTPVGQVVCVGAGFYSWATGTVTAEKYIFAIAAQRQAADEAGPLRQVCIEPNQALPEVPDVLQAYAI